MKFSGLRENEIFLSQVLLRTTIYMAGNSLQRLFKSIGINNCKICSSLGQSKALFFSRLFMKLNFLLPRREKKNVVDKQVLFGRTWVVDCVERGQCRGNN